MDPEQQEMLGGHVGIWDDRVPGLLENNASSGPERVQQVITETR